ncbi:hypothetical protein [Megalodesulfovibrio gigas]|uniref:Uncharacterized protein n=1 Tax=Megalodesulfovibrio gigas (strain ATCC 19364 / DSM 1382 / NCIMB 9332 / VKM B-1759) TaxID=1121448 RepID=T2G9Z7_MEGG1|nr:hypothetical protein [Megalodesulfovibrio gigas]AGW12732.1 hypothetical protein DGI_0837 [Megalodesulfovibrio gigas DSM 1382 = ATCC 19364]
MITIDGRTIDRSLDTFANLEELLLNLSEDSALENRVVTDVLVDGEAFSEIYPHQAEDIETRGIKSVEIVSVSVQQMAADITHELYTVVRLMNHGSKSVADLFRRADDASALEMLQDLLDVTRDFLSMVGVLRHEFSMRDNPDFERLAGEISDLFSEMSEVMENEDWILLADLLEYEFNPATEKWKHVLTSLSEDIKVEGA